MLEIGDRHDIREVRLLHHGLHEAAPTPCAQWSPRQEEVMGAVAFAVSLDDEEQKRLHERCLFVSGGPGCGKSAVLREVAVRSAKGGIRKW